MSQKQYLTEVELVEMGFKKLGRNVLIHATVVIVNPENIELGSNVRIDPFCVLSAGGGKISLGSNVHVAIGCRLLGSGGIQVGDFCGLSTSVTIFTATDDYSSGHLTNPTVPQSLRKVTQGQVVLQKHVIVGPNSIIMPRTEIGFGASIGAQTIVRRSVPRGFVVAGHPARKIGTRDVVFLEENESKYKESKNG